MEQVAKLRKRIPAQILVTKEKAVGLFLAESVEMSINTVPEEASLADEIGRVESGRLDLVAKGAQRAGEETLLGGETLEIKRPVFGAEGSDKGGRVADEKEGPRIESFLEPDDGEDREGFLEEKAPAAGRRPTERDGVQEAVAEELVRPKELRGERRKLTGKNALITDPERVLICGMNMRIPWKVWDP